MHIMVVCTGNICRSPMGELLLRRYVAGTSITVSSAGTTGLNSHEIDPSSKRIMDSVSIDSSAFRSRRLTRELAESADLILCFENKQRSAIVNIAPSMVRRTYLLTDFANMCLYCGRNGLVHGRTVEERLESVITSASFIRPMMPVPRQIADPIGKDFSYFVTAADQTNKALWTMLNSMRKHFGDGTGTGASDDASASAARNGSDEHETDANSVVIQPIMPATAAVATESETDQ